MSRTRLIKPEFFADEVIADLSRDARLVYIGLWTLCDDAGYFERRPRQIAVSLFGFDVDRDALVDVALAELAAAARIRWLECDKHGVIPTLPQHAQKGGNHAFTIKSRHAACGENMRPLRSVDTDSSGPVRTTTDKSRSESESESWSLSESDSKGAQARERRSLADASIDAGGFVATLASRRRIGAGG